MSDGQSRPAVCRLTVWSDPEAARCAGGPPVRLSDPPAIKRAAVPAEKLILDFDLRAIPGFCVRREKSHYLSIS